MIDEISLADGQRVPKLGQGTWMMGEEPGRRAQETAALRRGIELGMRLIDTAEMYGDGRTETLLGEALAGLRDEVVLVSKVLPGNASRQGTVAACEQSLRRLRTDRVDLYLLHWRGPHPLEETVAAFERLQRDGKIRAWGVSNFDVDDMQELAGLTDPAACATNQVLYNLARRGPEYDLLPWLAERRIPLMAYSPVDHARLPRSPVLEAIARRYEVTVTQLALAWVLQRPEVIAIPKASSVAHVVENHAAAGLQLAEADLAEIDQAFPPPGRKRALEML